MVNFEKQKAINPLSSSRVEVRYSMRLDFEDLPVRPSPAFQSAESLAVCLAGCQASRFMTHATLITELLLEEKINIDLSKASNAFFVKIFCFVNHANIQKPCCLFLNTVPINPPRISQYKMKMLFLYKMH